MKKRPNKIKSAKPEELTKEELIDGIRWHKYNIKQTKEGYFDQKKFDRLGKVSIESSLRTIKIYEDYLHKDLIKKLKDF